MKHKSPNFFNSLLSFSKIKIKENRTPLIAALIAGFLAHFYIFTNKLPNHDDVMNLFTKGATVDSGRWALSLLSYIFPDFSMSWLYGIITLLLVACAGCIMLRLLKVQNKILQVILISQVVVFPSLTSLYAYMFTSSCYGVAFLMSTLCAYLITSDNKWKKLSAYPFMIFTLAIYQPYLAITSTLLLIHIIQQIIRKECRPRVLWIRGLTYVVFLVSSAILYYLSVHIVLFLTRSQFNDYASSSLSLDLKTLFTRVVDTYYCFMYFFTRGYQGVLYTPLLRMVTMILLVIGGGYYLFFFCKASLGNKILLLICALVFPMCINCMYLLFAPESIHTLVVYSYVCIYFLVAVLVEESCTSSDSQQNLHIFSPINHHIKTHIAPLLLIFTVISFIYLANETYLRLQLSYENTYSFYTSLCADLANNPDFDENTTVAIIGQPPENAAERAEFEDITLIGSYGMVIRSHSKQHFINYYIGLDVDFASREEEADLAATITFKEMPPYPYYGSIKKIGDYLVVKLGDPSSSD